MAKLDRNGVAIHYEIHGKGPTILLSHGYSSTARMWDGQVAAEPPGDDSHCGCGPGHARDARHAALARDRARWVWSL